MSNIKFRFTLITGLLLTLVTYQTHGATETTVKPARVISTMTKTTVLVEAVNKETRELKLIDAAGERFSIVADDLVKNFDQIEPRDRIVIESFESVAIMVAPAGSEPLLGDAAALEVAEKGDKPGMYAGQTQVITATVTSLDLTDRLATLKMETGEMRTVEVSEDMRMDLVEVGDQVRLRVTQIFSVSVEKPKS